MKKKEAKEDLTQEEEKGKVLQFSVVPGGKQPPDKNWLEHLNPGAVFLCSRVGSPYPFVLDFFHIVHKRVGVCLLMNNLGKDQVNLWVDTEKFSSNHKFVSLLHEGEVQSE